MNPSLAFAGKQYLSVKGHEGKGLPVVARIVNLDDTSISNGVNDVFGYMVRFDKKDQNGLTTYWDANEGPFQIIRSVINKQGVIGYYTNDSANIVQTDVTINTGKWYKITYQAFPEKHAVRFTVNTASNGGIVFDKIIPMNSSGLATGIYGLEFEVENNPSNSWLIDNVSFSSSSKPTQ